MFHWFRLKWHQFTCPHTWTDGMTAASLVTFVPFPWRQRAWTCVHCNKVITKDTNDIPMSGMPDRYGDYYPKTQYTEDNIRPIIRL